MNKLFFITLLFFFSLQKAINALLCTSDLANERLESLSISYILKKNPSERDNLGLWIHFFFSHFEDINDLMEFLETLDINAIDLSDRSCFRKGLTVYLLHYYASELKSVSRSVGYEGYFENKFFGHEELAIDFLNMIKNPQILSLLDTIATKDLDIDKLGKSVFPIKKLLTMDKKGKPELMINAFEKLIYADEDIFGREFLNDYGELYNLSERRFLQDYNVLGFIGLKSLYYNSDLTGYVDGPLNIFNTSRRLGLKKRSPQYDIMIHGKNSKAFGSCVKGSHSYHGYVDDLGTFFISAMKSKMVKGHVKFLSDYKKAVEKKSWKMSGLKGFRLIKHFFQVKNFNNFINLYINHASTELNFLERDFDKLFDITFECNKEHINRAGEILFNMKQKK